jgi:hypothetical protein
MVKTLEKFHSSRYGCQHMERRNSTSRSTHIGHYLGSPHIIDLGGWKEEVDNFIINQYHGSHLWLEHLLGITGNLIHRIIIVPHGGDLIPKTPNPSYWIQHLIGSSTLENSKGFLINQVKKQCAKWSFIIISLFLPF